MRKDFIERQLTPEVLSAALEALAHQWAEAVAEVERLKEEVKRLKAQLSPDLIDE
jgi:cell division protein FtsB